MVFVDVPVKVHSRFVASANTCPATTSKTTGPLTPRQLKSAIAAAKVK